MSAWNWGPKLRKEFEIYGLEWQTTEQIPLQDLGTSPGDAVYLGRYVLLENSAPTWMVAHELAHYLVCRRDTPELLSARNYGFDAVFSHKSCGSRVRQKAGDVFDKTETLAAWVTLSILQNLHLPWHVAAEEMSMFSGYDETESWVYSVVLLSDREIAREVRKIATRVGERYLPARRPMEGP